MTVIRLLDGSKAFVQAVIDNWILAWRISPTLECARTASIPHDAVPALAERGAAAVTLMADSGVENINRAVDAALIETGVTRVLAQVEVAWSNSMNEVMPNAALGGCTPDEVLRGEAADLAEELRGKHQVAIAQRMAPTGGSNVGTAWSRYGSRNLVMNRRRYCKTKNDSRTVAIANQKLKGGRDNDPGRSAISGRISPECGTSSDPDCRSGATSPLSVRRVPKFARLHVPP